MRRGCLICVICKSKGFYSFIFKTLHDYCSHIEDVHLLIVHVSYFFSFLTGVELRHVFHPKCLGVPSLCNL